MYFYGSLVIMAVSFLVLTVFYFRTQDIATKIFYQSSVVVAFYVLLLVVSQIGLSIYPEEEKWSLTGVGYAMVIWGGLAALLATFVMGVAGAIRSYKDKETFLMVTSIIAMCVFPFLLPLFIFPFIFFYLGVLRMNKVLKDKPKRKKEKEIARKMAERKLKRGASVKKKMQ